MSNVEQTLSIIKPDAVERNLIEEIKKIFKKNNLNIKETKNSYYKRWKQQNSIKCTNRNHFFEALCSYLIFWTNSGDDIRG